jgi:hypothetical protein
MTKGGMTNALKINFKPIPKQEVALKYLLDDKTTAI